MDLNLQPLAASCFVSGEPFKEGDRVLSLLVHNELSEVIRYDLLDEQRGAVALEGTQVCRWVQHFKPRQKNEKPEHAMRMTAESLFVTLAEPNNEPDPETLRLIQFLALMLERKRILRTKGTRTDDEGGEWTCYEHAKTKQLFDLPLGDFSPEFFVAVQAQLSVLTGQQSEETEGETTN